MADRKVLFPLPSHDFDPTETAVPWALLAEAGLKISFATPNGKAGCCDPRMLTGNSLGPLAKALAANAEAVRVYHLMEASAEFRNPLHWKDLQSQDFDALVLPGGHAAGMREYLESPLLKKLVSEFFASKKPVGAICHGVVLAARSQDAQGRSVLYGKKTTCLLKTQELLAWNLTRLWLGEYYRTYPDSTVEDEVRSVLASPQDFESGPLPLFRDSRRHLKHGFALTDGVYVSARWPGDAHQFATAFLNVITSKGL